MAMASINQKILLHSPEGQTLLKESDTTHQPHLMQIFKKQVGPKTCGIHSAALLLSARYIGNQNQTTQCTEMDLPYTESNMFTFRETNHVIDKAVLKQKGCTLKELQSLFLAHNFKAKEYYSDEVDVSTFRAMASKAVTHMDSKCGVIVNYDEALLEQDVNGKGHFSPLAGYNNSRDMFLLLDTWWNTENVWVKTEFLFQAMFTIDYRGSGRHRGFMVLGE